MSMTEEQLELWLKKRHFPTDEEEANKIEDIGQRILFWKKLIKDFERYAPFEYSSRRFEGYISHVENELEYLKAEFKYQGNRKNPEPSDVPKTDGRKKGYDQMIKEAQRYLAENKAKFTQQYNGDRSPIVKQEILPYLKRVFPEAKNYPSESYLRNDVLYW